MIDGEKVQDEWQKIKKKQRQKIMKEKQEQEKILNKEKQEKRQNEKDAK